MKPARILLIVVAIVAGGLAAFLATRGNAPSQNEPQAAQTEVIQEARERVLVANGAIGLGQRLTASDVSWQDWPQGAVRSEYITATAVPDAPDQVAGAVARFEFFPGEPIREAKLVNSTQGYLSAVISEGMRAVSVSVGPDSASGGYIVPNDRVDIVLTRSGADYSETILSNIRVLAIGKRLGETGATGGVEGQNPSSQVFETTQIATFEVTPGQAEALLQAGTAGRLALVLRSVADFDTTIQADTGGGGDTVQQVKLIRNGQSQVVSTPAARPAPSSGTSVSALDQTPAAGTAEPAIEVR